MAWEDRGTLTSDGNTSSWEHKGGEISVVIEGDFGSGGTATLQMSPNDEGDTFASVGSVGVVTEDGVIGLNIAACRLRVNLDGSTSPNLNIHSKVNPAAVVNK